ncbi:glycosyltransferase family 39 protein [Okeania sp. SIO2B3]|uniref:glycosyltransferase family 39 protein n=1 Tax=Okeania sp. SIO2B3 TaxID=2607784 RepID=UPI0025E28B95|nr:glycosyltransferase family 39 protein [Okeania sp. SIO2B3]
MRKFNQDIQKIVNFWRRSLHSQWLLLLVWIAIATCLRLTNLDGKPPWTDEFSTLVFSLGNSFQDVPLDRAIAPEMLLQPLQFNVNTDINNVVDNLLTYSNHPPVYFILTHWWMQFFSAEGEFVSLWGARSLSVIFGVVSIPAIYGLARLAFHSRLVGQFAAAIMAVSPYGIYLAQEARHYTLAILFVIASFCCLIISIRHFQEGQSLPIFTAFIWVVVNSLGIATHYFFILTLCAEAMVLISLFFFEEGRSKKQEGKRKKLMDTQNSSKEGRGNQEEGERKKLMGNQTFTKEGRRNQEEGERKKLMGNQTFTKEGRGNQEEERRKNLMDTQTFTKEGRGNKEKERRKNLMDTQTFTKEGRGNKEKERRKNLMDTQTSSKEGRGNQEEGERKKLMGNQTFTKEGKGNKEKERRKNLMDTQTSSKEGRGNKEEGERKKLMGNQTFTKEGRGSQEKERRKNLMDTQTSSKEGRGSQEKERRKNLMDTQNSSKEGRGNKEEGIRKNLMDTQTSSNFQNPVNCGVLNPEEGRGNSVDGGVLNSEEGRGNQEEEKRKNLMDTQTSTNFKYPIDGGVLNSKEKVESERENRGEVRRKKLMETQTFTKEGREKKEEERRKKLMGTQTSTNFQNPVYGGVLNSKEKDNFSSLKVKKSSKFSLHTLIKSLANFYIVILGTLAGGLVWLPFWKNGYSSELTKWISISDDNLKSLLSPIFQFLATGITMLFLLPIESPIFPIAIISVVVMILFLIWLFPLFISGTINCLKNSDISISFITFAGVILASTLLFFSFTYIFGIDLTRGARYSFIYFPAVIILVAAILAQIFNQQFVKSKFLNVYICTTTGKKAVILIWLMALLSGLTVVSNLGYQKYYRPDLFVSLIEKKSDKPIVIATTYYTHVETGEFMGIAWNMRKKFQQKCRKESICQEKHLEPIKFILVEQKTDRENTVNSLHKIINRLEYPFDLWLVNFASDFNIAVEKCLVDKGEFPLIDGYKYQLYHCYFSGG